MKIASVKVSVLRVTPDTQYQAGGRTVDAYWHVLAEVTTSDGVHGFGYVVALASSMVPALASATRELGESLVGMHVLEPEAAWERLAHKGKWIGPGWARSSTARQFSDLLTRPDFKKENSHD